MNSINIAGRLVRDPEQKVVGDGVEMVKFTLAVDRYVGKDKPNAVDYFDCSVFGTRGAVIAKYCHQGDQLIVGGEMTSNTVDTGLEKPKKITYWGVKVNEFDFGSKKGSGSASSDDGFEDLTPDQLPF